MKATTLTAIATIIIIAGGVFLLTRNNAGVISNTGTENTQTFHRYFWSQTCPHCKNVAEFLDSWDKRNVFEIEKFEVNESRENSLLFLDVGTRICKIPRNQLGVPLLVTPDGKCYNGDVPIIEYLKNLEI